MAWCPHTNPHTVRHDGVEMKLSYRKRVLLMLALLVLFMAGLAISNTVNEVLGLAVCAVAVGLTGVIVFGLNRGR
jgi:outer membrane receptor for Fe3+-dicitrate